MMREPVRWSDEADELLGGDLTAAAAYITPAGGAVVIAVAPCGLGEYRRSWARRAQAAQQPVCHQRLGSVRCLTPLQPGRQRAMTGTLHSGTLLSDPRSDDRSHP